MAFELLTPSHSFFSNTFDAFGALSLLVHCAAAHDALGNISGINVSIFVRCDLAVEVKCLGEAVRINSAGGSLERSAVDCLDGMWVRREELLCWFKRRVEDDCRDVL